MAVKCTLASEARSNSAKTSFVYFTETIVQFALIAASNFSSDSVPSIIIEKRH